MTAAAIEAPALSADAADRLNVGGEKSLAHRLSLVAVWLTVASGFMVFSEPAPIDALTMGLMVLLPAIGLFKARPVAGGYVLWLIVATFLAVGCVVARDTDESTKHSLISFYLYSSCFLFAGFIAKNPVAHGRLVMNAYYVATLIAATAGIVGYLNLFPGAYDMLTRYGRATGTFKDPNVFGPFLIPGLLMSLHMFLERPLRRGLLPILAAGLIATAILLSFSRGAWAISALGVAIYGVFYLYNAEHDAQRLKVIGLAAMVATLLVLVIAVALQSDAVSELLRERATLEQPYDQGPDGRFGGQVKAFGIILDNPFGIGSHAFTHYYHHEEAHNVYLSMMMDAGWFGGLTFLMICAGTLVLGWLHAMKRTRTRHLFIIAYAALAGIILEGAIIDIYHWRHFYLLMGIVWGLMAGDRLEVRPARIVGRCRETVRRRCRIIAALPQAIAPVSGPMLQPALATSGRRGRIIGPLA